MNGMNEETREIFVSVNRYKAFRSVYAGTRASTNRFSPPDRMDVWMCDRSQRLRWMSPTRNLFAVARARLLATVNLAEEWLCKESAGTPLYRAERDFLT